MAKDRRRYCDNPKCGRQYRYSRDDSKTCSDACRAMLSRVNRAEQALADADLKRTVAAKWRRIQQARAAQPTTAAPPPESVDRTPDARPAAKCGCIGRDFGHMKGCPLNPAPKSVVVTIRNMPTHFPGTALGRGFR